MDKIIRDKRVVPLSRIAKQIEQVGGRLYLVGGAVRDQLLGIENHDEDYCVTGILPDDFLKLFPNAMERGKSFHVYDIEGREFAFARVERKTGFGHKEFEIEANKEITIIDDLRRRDITINSVAKDVLTGELIDPYHGVEDIKNKIIRATSESFLEDPLRVYRVARFASKFEFEIEQHTIELMSKLKGELLSLSKERVFVELKKVLECQKPSIFFEVLKQANVLDIHFKEIYDLIGKTQPEKWHPEGDAYNHTLNVLDESVKLTEKLEIRFSCFVHDLGKGTTKEEMLPHHYGHDERGPELVGKLGKRIGVPSVWLKCGKIAAKEHMIGGIFYRLRPEKMVRFIQRVDRSHLGLEGLKIVVIADRCSDRNCEKENIDFDHIRKSLLRRNKWGICDAKI